MFFFYIALGFCDIFVDFTFLDFKQKFMKLVVNKQTNKQTKKQTNKQTNRKKKNNLKKNLQRFE